MATDQERLDAAAKWIRANQDKQGTPEWEKVTGAYKQLRGQSPAPQPQAQSERDPLAMQFLGKFTEGLASLPGLPLDAIIGGGNFLRRQFDIPEFEPNERLRGWTGEGWSDAIMGAAGMPKVAAPVDGVERIVQKAGQFFGGAAPFGPAGIAPTIGSIGVSELGRVADQEIPEVTKGYGEFGGALVGGVTPAAARRGLVPRTSPEQARLAENLMQNDVPVYPGQLATNQMTRNTYDLANKLSVYDNLADARQSDAIARMMARTMGENETNLVQASGQATDRLSGVPHPNRPVGPKLAPGEYDQIYARIGDHPVDQIAGQEINILAHRAQQLSERTRNTVNHAIQNVRSAIQPNGRLPVRGFKDLTDRGGVLSELENSANPAVALYGTQLRMILENNIRRQASPADAQALAQADRQWRHLKTLEPVLARSANAEGQVSPSLLQNAIATSTNRANARGAANMPELETLAQAGKSFLKPPRTSGTAERNAMVGLLTGAAGTGGFAAGGPIGAAASIGTAVAAPLAARYVLQRQWLTRLMINDALRRGANPSTIRRMLQRLPPAVPGAIQGTQ